jgi:hypothetical protein
MKYFGRKSPQKKNSKESTRCVKNSAVLQRIAVSTLHEFSFVLDRVFGFSVFLNETLL